MFCCCFYDNAFCMLVWNELFWTCFTTTNFFLLWLEIIHLDDLKYEHTLSLLNTNQANNENTFHFFLNKSVTRSERITIQNIEYWIEFRTLNTRRDKPQIRDGILEMIPAGSSRNSKEITGIPGLDESRSYILWESTLTGYWSILTIKLNPRLLKTINRSICR